jgi:hypothetical protein
MFMNTIIFNNSSVVFNNTLFRQINKYLKKNRTVRFSNVVNVILIPNCNEYVEADLHDVLWYTRAEISSFMSFR